LPQRRPDMVLLPLEGQVVHDPWHLDSQRRRAPVLHELRVSRYARAYQAPHLLFRAASKLNIQMALAKLSQLGLRLVVKLGRKSLQARVLELGPRVLLVRLARLQVQEKVGELRLA
jgi:hypothetical protein